MQISFPSFFFDFSIFMLHEVTLFCGRGVSPIIVHHSFLLNFVATFKFFLSAKYFFVFTAMPGHSFHPLASNDFSVLTFIASLHLLTSFPHTARTLKLCSVSVKS